jgi:ATP-binding cassette, subfamily B, bacterial
MRDSLRALRLMLAISWRSDRVRTAVALLTASSQYLVLPLRAVGLELLANGAASGSVANAVGGVALVVALTAVNRLSAWTSFNVRMRLRENTQLYLDTHLMERMAGIPGIAHHELPEYLDEMERLRNERPYLANPFNPISWTAASIAQTVVVMVLLGSVNPLFALLPLFGLPAAKGTADAEKRAIGVLDAQAEENRTLRHLLHLATDPGPAKEVRVFELGDELIARRRMLFANLEHRRLRVARQRIASMSFRWILFAAAYGAMLLWTANEVRLGHTEIGTVALVLTLGAQVNAQLAEMALNVAWLSRSIRAVRRLVWFEDYSADTRETALVSDPSSPPERIKRGITFESVEFAYPDTQHKVLEDVSLVLPAGTTIAIVGENGAGKTTLVKLLARMYEPTFGRVRIDDVDLASIPADVWRGRISAGFQDFARFELLVRHAVGVGDVSEEPTDAVVELALERAVARDLAGQLPMGFDSQLGRSFGGSELSIGQWQKVALGRAMMRPVPLLLVLDEPTASLDAQTEHGLFERFTSAAQEVAAATGGITLLISHRFSTVRMADLIIVMSRGRIAESGSHDELMRLNGLYAQLYLLQARSYQ